MMFLSAAGCVWMVYILCISGVEGKPNSIFALKGSSVNLSCSAPHSAANIKWYIVRKSNAEYVYHDVSAYRHHEEFRLSEDNFTLTIRDLTEDNTKSYCCSETIPKEKPDETDSCQQNSIQLQVIDLQVKVFPASEGQKVSLMCSSSCSLTESPAAFIWYQNGAFLYEDWSPWYQELVSSDRAVRYSCAIKGYEDLRAPDVSVDSVSGSCFSVTYAEGTMCSYKSQKQSCSITFPTEVRVERTKFDKDHIKMTCNSSCSLTDNKTSFQLYKNTETGEQKVQNSLVPISSTDSFFCTVKDRYDLLSNEVCVDGSNCWTVSYDSRRICGLKGSSMNISSKYSHPEQKQPLTKRWYKMKINTKLEEEVLENNTDVNYQDDTRNQHILRLNNLDEKNSGEYEFRMKTDSRKSSHFSGVTLIVTGLLVDVRPAAEVTEGQRVTLTCSTSCPLSENTNYIWYLNSRPLSLTKIPNNRLIIDAVSRQDEGNYSCSVETINSPGKTLTVQQSTTTFLATTVTWILAAAGLSVFLLGLVPLTVFLYRKFKPSHQSSKSEPVNNMDEIHTGDMYEEFAAQPAEHELHYSQIALEKMNPIYSSVQKHPEQEHVAYSVVRTRTSTSSDSSR
ncbi:uncharacterized protein LOC111608551 isoform X2 [Xiphophorus maculatus]|uniref:Uncharacterized LOC111608551 n=1 Tax=Xiphophorus maculatus TaxID=8083 RepID=A0A3B5PRS1_XIPMA|nr:uncharacterized protein LOC111608551 isoform X2 [Xiphophorus maculatus]